MDELLSAGALSVMMSDEYVDEAVLVQVLGSLKLDGIVDQRERYRLVISDGQHVISHVMLAVKLNDMGTTTPPARFSVIHVKEYFTTLIPRPDAIRIMLVLADIQVVFSADEIQGQIGNPSALFDEDVTVPRDSSLSCLPEPVFESVSTEQMECEDLPPVVEQQSKAVVQEALPVVQALPAHRLRSVRALSPTIMSSSGIFRAASQLTVPNASTDRAMDLTRRYARVKLPIPGDKSPNMQGTKPAVKVTYPATPKLVQKPSPAVQLTPAPTPKLVQKPSPVQISTPAGQLTPAAARTPMKKTPAFPIRPTVQLTPAATPKLVQKSSPVHIPTPAVKLTYPAARTPMKKLSAFPIRPAVKVTPAATPELVPKPLPVHIPKPAVKVTYPATPKPVPKPSHVQMPTPVVKRAPGTAFSTSVPSVTPIANLRPAVTKWTIKARVTAKSPVKRWASGAGCSFTADLADESGEIKATVFTEWVDKYFSMFQKDQVYYISRANMKPSNKRFNHLNHDYEMIINGATSVVPCDEQVTIVEAKYKFVPLDKVGYLTHGSVVDVIGVCISAAAIESVKTRGGVMPKRELTLVDQSFTTVGLKLWGEHASTFEPTNRPIIAVRGAMVNEYWGVMNLTTLVSSAVKINPDIAEAQRLRHFFSGVDNY